MTEISFSRLRVILLDRDGVINHEPGPILNPKQFSMIQGSADAVARINAKGWKCFVITNQSAIARGDLREDIFEQITNKMHLEVKKSGAHIDGQYFFRIHPD
jgi:HAD-superfamily hydrolase, subfamily IIIA